MDNKDKGNMDKVNIYRATAPLSMMVYQFHYDWKSHHERRQHRQGNMDKVNITIFPLPSWKHCQLSSLQKR